MNIKRLVLEHYGCFHQKELLFRSGLNVVYGKNEAGKSTIRDFIVAMLFGAERSRGVKARTDMYNRRKPLEQGGYSGVLEYENQGQQYCIERNFLKNEAYVKIHALSTGQAYENEWLAQQLRIDRHTYSNTLCITDTGAAYGEQLCQQLQNKLVNQVTTGGDSIHLEKAYNYLKEKKKALGIKELEQRLRKISEKLTPMDLEGQLQQIRADRNRLEQEFAREQEREIQEYLRQIQLGGYKGYTEDGETWDEVQNKEENWDETASEESECQEEYEIGLGKGTCLRILWCIFMLLALLLLGRHIYNSFTAGQVEYVYLILEAVLALGLFIGIRGIGTRKTLNSTHEIEAEEEQDRKRIQKRRMREQGMQYTARLAELEGREQQLLLAYERWQRLEEEYQQLSDKLAKARQQEKAIELAYQRISDLSANYYGMYGTKLQELVNQCVEQITLGRYQQVSLDQQLNIKLRKGNHYLSPEQLSTGTLQQIYLAVRLAVAQQLGVNHLPLMIDDGFFGYDDERLVAMLQYLGACELEQVIIFTANENVLDALDSTDMEYNYIEM